MKPSGDVDSGQQVDIALLSDVPSALPVIAHWQYGEWGFLDSSDSVGSRAQKLEFHLHRDRLPLTLVATIAGEAVGSADLVPTELPKHQDLGPWLSCVFVASDFRGRGIGGRLTSAAESLAAKLGFSDLYLATWNRINFYRRLGWASIRSFESRGATVAIMTKRLPS